MADSSSIEIIDPMEIIAHRGASYDAPENTLAAVRLGWEQGADAVEIDCRMTHDGRIVMIHDPDTRRTASENLVVRDTTFAELYRLDVGRWKGAAWIGERIEPIEAVIETIPRNKRLFVEVKCGREINEALLKTLRSAPCPPESFAIISYDLAVVEGVKRAMPKVAAYLVARFEHDQSRDVWSPTVGELVELARGAALDGLDIQSRSYVDKAFVATVRAAGLDTYVWTVDDVVDARRLIVAGVRGIATNRPQQIRSELSKPDRTPL